VFDEPKQQMSAEKLAELIEGITAGKTIQMLWTGGAAYVNMEKCSLEDYLHVFLQPLDKYTRFRVKQARVEPTSPFHQECIDLVKDYKLNKEALEVQEALNLIKCSIKAAIKNIGSTKHKFSFATSPFGGTARRNALMFLSKELPNKYDVVTDTWTFYTSPEVQM
jgi:hypothetical protein